MKINEVIKEKRHELGLTQEQIADYLGVSTPAVNKWEKGNSYPDITLLPPLARLLKIDLNTLLSFQEDLTEHEIGMFLNELFALMSTEGFEGGFDKALDKLREYPTCDKLIMQVAMVLKGGLVMFGIVEKAHYEAQINGMFEKLAESKESEVRHQAIAMLINHSIEKKDYEGAQNYVDKLPNITYDKLEKQGNIYMESGELDKASELFERKLISTTTEVFTILAYMMEIALKEERYEDAKYFAEVVEKMNGLFDLWDYNTYVTYFQLYTRQKDVEGTLATIKKMLPAIRKKWDTSESKLYRHIEKKEVEDAEHQQFSQVFIDLLKNDPNNDLDFVKGHPQFVELLN
ncbi:MAG: helix-turn-helix domain-containing protein [Cellulosilyticaceae bacterium]